MIVHEDHKAPIVAVTIWYHVGSKNEVPGKTGFAHLFEHLMFNGSENYNDEYFRPLQEVGATNINGTTDFDRTNYFETVPTSALDLALWMESDRMGISSARSTRRSSTSSAASSRTRSARATTSLRQSRSTTIVTNLFPPGHPYSWETIGSMEDLNAASLDDVKKWFQTYYGPNNATLVLAGDIDLATAKEKVQRFFGDIPPGPPLIHRERWIPGSAPASRIVMQDRVPEARVYKVWLGPEWISDDSTYLQLADSVLTSGKTSRLYQRLVYDDQIATDAGAFALNNEIAGGYIVYATVGAGQEPKKVERALDEEIARFLAQGPTRAELERAKTRDSSLVHPRHRAGRRLSAASRTSLPRTPCSAAGPISTSIRSSCCTRPRHSRSSRPRERGSRATPLVLEVQPFPDELGRDRSGADRSKLPMPQSFPASAVPGAEPGHARERDAAHRGRAPRGAGRAVQPAAQRGLRRRPVRDARRREHDDGRCSTRARRAWTRCKIDDGLASLGADWTRARISTSRW